MRLERNDEMNAEGAEKMRGKERGERREAGFDFCARRGGISIGKKGAVCVFCSGFEAFGL